LLGQPLAAATPTPIPKLNSNPDPDPDPDQAALAQHSPHVVLCCWMPLGQDWSVAMRAAASVTHYLLIGEIDDGCCGVPWRGGPKPSPNPDPDPDPDPR